MADPQKHPVSEEHVLSQGSETTSGHGLSTVRQVLKGGTSYAAVSVAQRAISLLLFPFFARQISAGEYGRLALLWSVTSVLIILFSFGLEAAVFRNFFALSETPEKRNDYMKSVDRFLIVAPNGVALLIGLVGTPVIRATDLFPVDYWVMGVLTSSIFASGTVVPFALLRAQQRFSAYVWMNAANVATFVLLMVLLVLALEVGPRGWVIANLAAAVMIFITGRILVPGLSTGKFDLSALKSALAFGLPILPHSLSHWGLSMSDRLVLGAYGVTTRAIGVYSIGYQVAWVLGMLFTALNHAVMPEFGRTLETPAHEEQLKRVVTFQVLVTLLLGLSVALVGGPAARLVLPDSYAGIENLVPWVSLGAILFGLYYVPMGTLVMLEGDTKWLWVASGGSALVNVLLNVAFVPEFGVMAAAINTVVGYALLLIVVSAYTWARYHRLITPDWNVVGVAVIVCLVTYLVGSSLSPQSFATATAVRTLCALTAGGLLWVTYVKRLSARVAERGPEGGEPA